MGRDFRQHPETSDAKPIIVLYPAREGFNSFVTGRCDVITGTKSRGTGQRINFSWAAGEAGPGGTDKTKTVNLRFLEPVEVHDGRSIFGPTESVWNSGDDNLSITVTMDPCPHTSRTTELDGNANKVPSGLGFDIFVPAAGDGNAQLDLGDGTSADLGTVIPLADEEKTDGYWNTDFFTGVVTPAPNGDGNTTLMDLAWSSTFVNEVPIGEGHRTFDVDPSKSEWMHPAWKAEIEVTKETAGEGWLSGWLFIYREKTQKGPI